MCLTLVVQVYKCYIIWVYAVVKYIHNHCNVLTFGVCYVFNSGGSSLQMLYNMGVCGCKVHTQPL